MFRSILFARLIPLTMLLTLTVSQATALQEGTETSAEPTTDLTQEAASNPVDPLGRETPIGSIEGFVKAADAFEWTIAENYLDLRNLPANIRQMNGEQLAEQFYFILQRREVNIDSGILSDSPDGQLIDELPEYRDELARINTLNGEITLLMQRVPGPDGMQIWKISNKTVARIPALYKEFSYPLWVENLRDRLPAGHSFLGLELYKWAVLLGVALILTPLGWLIAYGIARLFSSPGAPLWKQIRKLLTGPVLALVVIVVLGQFLKELGVGATAAKIVQAKTLITVFTIWFIWSAVDLWRARRRVRYEAEGRTDAAVLGRPVANAVKLIVLLLGLLVWLANAGVDITALMAGLGIGGIAMALALQKPIEDLFGAISIYSQQPVSTGDLCRYGNSVGRVEEIGLRTTRIRTLSNTLVNIPNAQLSAGIIENLTARTKIIYHPDLPLRYDTSRDQIERLISALSESLSANPRVEDSTVRVRLAEFTANAIIIRVRIFAETRNFDEYLEIIQGVNLDIMSLMDQLDVRFAQGAQTLFIEGNPLGQTNAQK